MDNEKDTSKTINNMMNSTLKKDNKPLFFNENDSIEVNNLISLTDADITPDLLDQLENKAKVEQAKMLEYEKVKEDDKSEDIQISEGFPAEDGAISVSGEILERPIVDEPEKPKVEETLDPLEEAKMNAAYKKYVVYINKENEKFIDSLSINERKDVINKVLYDQNALTEEQRAERRKVEMIVKIVISIVTFIIMVPLIYLIFNISMEATIQNYKHSKSNFEILYKETGKIKINQ